MSATTTFITAYLRAVRCPPIWHTRTYSRTTTFGHTRFISRFHLVSVPSTNPNWTNTLPCNSRAHVVSVMTWLERRDNKNAKNAFVDFSACGRRGIGSSFKLFCSWMNYPRYVNACAYVHSCIVRTAFDSICFERLTERRTEENSKESFRWNEDTLLIPKLYWVKNSATQTYLCGWFGIPHMAPLDNAWLRHYVVAVHTPPTRKTRIQTLSALIYMYHWWALMRATLESDASRVQLWLKDLQFMRWKLNSKGSPQKENFENVCSFCVALE